MKNNQIKVETHNGIKVVRDDLLLGGTKSILMPYICDNRHIKEFVYASTVYGGMQIALAAYCKEIGKKATIFCAKRKIMFENTTLAKKLGAKIVEVDFGMLSNVTKKAQEYTAQKDWRERISLGMRDERTRAALVARVRLAIQTMRRNDRHISKLEPDEIWCAVGSGFLLECILEATTTAKVIGVKTLGSGYANNNPRCLILKYKGSPDKPTMHPIPFPTTRYYDGKAFEMCDKNRDSKRLTMFWNVLG